MAKLSSNELIWLSVPVPHCAVCGGVVYPDEQALVLGSKKKLREVFEVWECERCGRLYGMLMELLYLLEEGRIDSKDLDVFYLDGRKLTVRVWVDPEQGLVKWKRFKKVLDRIPNHPKKSQKPLQDREVRALKANREVWEADVHVFDWVASGEEDEEPALSYAMVVTDAKGKVRGSSVQLHPFKEAEAAAGVIFEAAARPNIGKPERPRILHLAESLYSEALVARLAAVEIAAIQAPAPVASAALEHLSEAARMSVALPYLVEEKEATLRAFFRSARRFFRAYPWERVSGTRYIGFQIDDGPWGYLNVMGQDEEEFGLSYLGNWLALCQTVNTPPPLMSYILEGEEPGIGEVDINLEGVVLSPLYVLHPEDAHYLLSLGIKPIRQGFYGLPYRYAQEGLIHTLLSLDQYRLLMDALIEVMKKRSGRKITSIKKTLEINGSTVTLRYPAKGGEELPEEVGHFKIVVQGQDLDVYRNPLPEGSRLEIDAPGTASVSDVAAAIRKTLGDGFWAFGMGTTTGYYWNDGMGRWSPSPKVAQVSGQPNLWIKFSMEPHEMEVMPRLGSGSDEVQVVLIGVER